VGPVSRRYSKRHRAQTLYLTAHIDNQRAIRFYLAAMEQISLDRLTGLIAFSRAASLGSYSAAARALGVTPSAISKSIQRLEHHFELKLFNRTTRSLTLTQEGRDLHERTLRLLSEMEAIEQTAAAARAGPAGILKVTAPLPIGVHLIAPALPAFRKRFPKLSIDLRLNDRLADLVGEGFDVAIRVGDLAGSRLISRELSPHYIGAYASPDYLAKRGVPRHPDDLVDHDCVNFRFQSSGQMLRWTFAAGEGSLSLTPDAGIVVDTSDAVAAVMAAGGGVGISPTYVAASYVRRGELVPILTEFVEPRSTITALWPESRRGSPNVKVFLAYLKKVFASYAADQ
jgi:DNA-binding transcriptional LysR family regulator